MPAKTLVVEKPVQKQLLKLPIKIHQRILQSLTLIKDNPIVGEKLHGELANYYKLRIGDYRVIYKFDKENLSVEVVKIEHRQGVYR